MAVDQSLAVRAMVAVLAIGAVRAERAARAVLAVCVVVVVEKGESVCVSALGWTRDGVGAYMMPIVTKAIRDRGLSID